MSLGFQKHVLHLEALHLTNPKTLVLADDSHYMEAPVRPVLAVLPPGAAKYHSVSFVAQQLNTFNSNTLGLTEGFTTAGLSDLPDGVWQFVYQICPYETARVTFSYLRTVQLDLLMDCLYDHLELTRCCTEEDEEVRAALVELFLLRAKGVADARRGRVAEAAELYRKAAKKAEHLHRRLTAA